MSAEKKSDPTLIGWCMEKTFSDATLIVGDEKIPVHKIVLASQSQHFYNIFSTEDCKVHDIFNLETDADTVKLVLR